VFVQHAQIYESGVVESLFKQCTRVVVSSDRWRRVAQLPAEVQASVCEEITGDPGCLQRRTCELITASDAPASER
jgi:hypothetical protein